MATKIYTGYPRNLKTKLLVDAIDEYADEINKSGADVNKVLQYAPYISLGLNELQSRQSRRITRISLFISFLSLFIAGSALYVSYENSLASSRWEENQLEILRQLDSKFEVKQLPIEKQKDEIVINPVPEKPANKELQDDGSPAAPAPEQ